MGAKVHNLQGRGTLETGGYADIVLVDMPNLNVTANEIEPRKHPEGIKYVFVNGEPVVREGKHTGARPGRVLRRV
jgi:N-acyl-D-aspartate/D-glutamate deacylase